MFLELSDLTVEYPGGQQGHVLENISFSVEKGHKLALIGANGAGKSTLLLTLVGLVPVHSGNVSFDGINLEKSNYPLIRQKAGLVFQNPDDQLFMSTVIEDVLFGPKNYAAKNRGNIEIDALENKALAILEGLEIAHLKDRMSHKLSGGEKRLAALASVLSMEPEMLLMDEPSSFLDPRARRRLISVIGQLPQASIIATHDLDFAARLCPEAIILKNGKLHAFGATSELLNNAELLDDCGM